MALCLIGGALLATDAVQERLIRIAGRTFYGAEVSVRAPSFIGAFRAERIEICDPYSGTAEPTVRMDDVVVAYSLRRGASHLIESVRVGRLDLRADFTDSASSNAQWLRELWDAQSVDTEPVPPPKVEIAEIFVAFHGPSASGELEWAGLSVEPTASGGWRLDVESEHVSGWIHLESETDSILIRDAVTKIHIEQKNPGLQGDFLVEVPQLFRVVGGLGESEDADSPKTDKDVVVRIETFEVFGERLAKTTPIPVEFEMLRLTQGTLRFPENDDSGMAFDFVLNSVRYGEIEVQDVMVSGLMHWSGDTEVLGLDELVMVSASETDRVIFSDWEIAFGPVRAQGAFEAVIDLATVGAALQEEALWGDAQFKGTAELDEDRVVVSFTMVSDVAGYDDWMTPYQMPITGEGVVEYDLLASQLTSNGVELQLGSGTRMAFSDWSITTSEAEMSGRVELTSDLDAVVAMGLLDSARGSVDASLVFAYRDETPSGSWTVRASIDALVLTEQAASLRDFASTLSGTWEAGLQGSGELDVALLSVAGGEAHDISGDVTIDDNVLRMRNMSAQLFGGRLTADVALRLEDEDLSLTLDAEIRGLDFERFTQEVEPPSLSLTGRANGRLDLEYSLDGLQRFLFTITSDEGLSVNRGLIEEALRADTLRETLGERRLRKTMDTLLGTAPQRPFDSGELTVRLEAERFVGVTHLKSVKTRDYNGLNLNIELSIDLPALVATLKLLEESSGGAVDF